jgi:AcrR family transcriptional regulator
MTGTKQPADTEVDGRRARRERGRLAVIDAMVDLIQSGHTIPTAQQVADRAGVSASSLFRYFTDLDELREHTIERFFERYAELFEVPAIGEGPLDQRVERYVAARLRLYETIAPISRLVRSRSLDHPALALNLGEVRRRLADQTRTHFAPELARRRPAGRDDLVSVVSTLTSFESWDQLHDGLGRSANQVRRAWAGAVAVLLAGP